MENRNPGPGSEMVQVLHSRRSQGWHFLFTYLVNLTFKGIADSNENLKFQYRFGMCFISTEESSSTSLCSEDNCIK